MQARSHKVNCLLPEKSHVDYDLRRRNMYQIHDSLTNRYSSSLISWDHTVYDYTQPMYVGTVQNVRNIVPTYVDLC